MMTHQDQERLTEETLAHLIHDLRTPIVNISWGAKRLRDGKIGGPIDDHHRKALDTILRNCRRLEHDLNQIMEYASAEAVSDLRKETFDLVEEVNKTIETFKAQAQEKGISLKTALPDSPLYLEADRQLIHKTIANLVDNALKYTEPGGWVEVSISEEDADIHITVSDTGKGLDQEEIQNIFLPFEQVIGIEDRQLRGVGLGLSNVQQYVELHNGHIDLESEPGKGSTFTVVLPKSHASSS
jgi:signal transduction histidine kinase